MNNQIGKHLTGGLDAVCAPLTGLWHHDSFATSQQNIEREKQLDMTISHDWMPCPAVVIHVKGRATPDAS